MGIDVRSSTVEIEINGVVYHAAVGDPDLLNRIRQFAVQMAQTDYATAVNLYQEISDKVHEFVAELFGEQAETEIFAPLEGHRDIVAELKLFAEVNRVINQSEALMTLDKLIGDFGMAATI